MINWLHSKFHDPNSSWDPITAEYAQAYAREAVADPMVVTKFTQVVGGLAGRRVADLASGPGQYALEFARLGATVSCIDISRTYLSIARQRLRAEGLEGHYLLGYIDRIDELSPVAFDAVFSNISWNYCMNDFSFARHLLRSVKPGGIIFVRETNENYVRNRNRHRKLAYAINKVLGIKIGHPHPPRGRIAAAFANVGDCEVSTVGSDPEIDVVTIRRRQ